MKRKELYAELDSSDNTITLSDGLWRSMGIRFGRTSFVCVFRIKGTTKYAMRRVPMKFAIKTTCGIVDYNPILKSVGFTSLIPTVNLMLYDMGIDIEKVRISVMPKRLGDGSLVFIFDRDEKGY